MEGGYYNNITLNNHEEELFNKYYLSDGKPLEYLDKFCSNLANTFTNNSTIINSDNVILSGSFDKSKDIYRIKDDFSYEKLTDFEKVNLREVWKKVYSLQYYKGGNIQITEFFLTSIYSEILRINGSNNGFNMVESLKYNDNGTYDFYDLFFNGVGDITSKFNPVKILIDCNMLYELYEILKLKININNIDEYNGYSFNQKNIQSLLDKGIWNDAIISVNNILKNSKKKIINMVSIQRVNTLTIKLLNMTSKNLIGKYFKKIGLVKNKELDYDFKLRKYENGIDLYDLFNLYISDAVINEETITFISNDDNVNYKESIYESLQLVFELNKVNWKEFINDSIIFANTQYSAKLITDKIQHDIVTIKNYIIEGNIQGLVTYSENLQSYHRFTNLKVEGINDIIIKINNEIDKVSNVITIILEENCIFTGSMFCSNYEEIIREKMSFYFEEEIINSAVELMRNIVNFFNSEEDNLIYKNISKLEDEVLGVKYFFNKEIKKINDNISQLNVLKAVSDPKKGEKIIKYTEMLNKINDKNISEVDKSHISSELGIKSNKISLEQIRVILNKKINKFSEDVPYDIAIKNKKREELIILEKNELLKNNDDIGYYYYYYVIIFLIKIIHIWNSIRDKCSVIKNHSLILFIYINEVLKSTEYEDPDKIIKTYNLHFPDATVSLFNIDIVNSMSVIKGVNVFGVGDCVETAIRNFINYLIYDPINNRLDISKIIDNENVLDDVKIFYQKYNTIYKHTSHQAHIDWCYLLSNLKGILEKERSLDIDDIFRQKRDMVDGDKIYYELIVDLNSMMHVFSIIFGDTIIYINKAFNKKIILKGNLLFDENFIMKIEKGHIEFQYKSKNSMEEIYFLINSALRSEKNNDSDIDALYDDVADVNDNIHVKRENFDIEFSQITSHIYYSNTTSFVNKSELILPNFLICMINNNYSTHGLNNAELFLSGNILLYSKAIKEILQKNKKDYSLKSKNFKLAVLYKMHKVGSNDITAYYYIHRNDKYNDRNILIDKNEYWEYIIFLHTKKNALKIYDDWIFRHFTFYCDVYKMLQEDNSKEIIIFNDINYIFSLFIKNREFLNYFARRIHPSHTEIINIDNKILLVAYLKKCIKINSIAIILVYMYKLEDLVLGEDKYNLSMLTNHSITFDLRLCSRIFDDAQKLALIEYAMIYYTKNMDKENATNIMKKIDPTNMFNNSIDNFLDLKFEQHNEKKLKLEDFKRAFIDTNFKYANTGTKN